ncbi:hypothetical protein [Bradyrhizobium vignae]|uniref:hypothetical protein n=1 Tax=Bradyrhizobium vignae TaxID=1549949 RepID=UPI00289C1E38|nr:hypothetical protein [Bradyrhizobium vignae]
MAHVDMNILSLTAAQSADFGGGKAGGGYRRLAGDGDTKRGWDLWLGAGQPHAIQGGRITADGGPDTAKNIGGALHGRFSPFPGA